MVLLRGEKETEENEKMKDVVFFNRQERAYLATHVIVVVVNGLNLSPCAVYLKTNKQRKEILE